MTNAFHVDMPWIDPKTVGERGEDANLVGRVVAVNVQGWFGFGITETLRVGQDIAKLGSLEFHPSQDVIARAIDDSVEAGDAISNEPFAQDLDNGYAARDAGFVIQIRAAVLRRCEQLFAVRREERLVGGDHRFTEPQRSECHLARCRGATHQFHDEIDLRVVDDGGPVGG